MSTSETNCGECKKFIPARIRVIKCDTCEQFFHINHRTYNSIKQSNNDWHCKKCASNVSNTDKLSAVNAVRVETSVSLRKRTTKKIKCSKCKKNMPIYLRVINCDTCKKYFHVKCPCTNKKYFLDLKLKNENW